MVRRWLCGGGLMIGLMKSVVLVVTMLAANAFAAVEVGRSSGASCTPLIQTIKIRWMDVKDHMQPASGRIKRPEQEHFICLSTYAIRNAVERRLSTSAQLRCFSNPSSRGIGICCDDPITACTQLNPQLFPELQRKKKQKEYEPPKSNWVRPPSDSEGMQSIDD